MHRKENTKGQKRLPAKRKRQAQFTICEIRSQWVILGTIKVTFHPPSSVSKGATKAQVINLPKEAQWMVEARLEVRTTDSYSCALSIILVTQLPVFGRSVAWAMWYFWTQWIWENSQVNLNIQKNLFWFHLLPCKKVEWEQQWHHRHDLGSAVRGMNSTRWALTTHLTNIFESHCEPGTAISYKVW